MPKDHATIISRTEARELAAAIKDAFGEILTKIEATQREGGEGTRLFPSGIELISLTLKVGPNIEFSVRVAGKDAPKVEAALHSAEGKEQS